MTTVVTRLFDTFDHARNAVAALESQGVAQADISVVANSADGGDDPSTESNLPSEAAAGAGTGATLGTIVGGGAGLLAGLGVLAIPGVGPVVAAGWLVAAAAGAGAGAAGGGLLGSLVGAGVSETDAHVYAEGVRRGGTLVTVRAGEDQVRMAERTLNAHHAVDAVARGNEYHAQGWSAFDETAPTYGADGKPRRDGAGTTTLL